MKKYLIITTILILMTTFLCGCVMFIPNSASIGESKTFEKDGIKLLLTDKFMEQKSELGFDAYYVSNFCGVMVMKESFSLEEGLSERELSEYIKNVIANNGHTDIEPQNKDGLWYYVKDTGTTRVFAYCYKGSDAFWIVQYTCTLSDAKTMENVIHLWAQAVEVE